MKVTKNCIFGMSGIDKSATTLQIFHMYVPIIGLFIVMLLLFKLMTIIRLCKNNE